MQLYIKTVCRTTNLMPSLKMLSHFGPSYSDTAFILIVAQSGWSWSVILQIQERVDYRGSDSSRNELGNTVVTLTQFEILYSTIFGNISHLRKHFELSILPSQGYLSVAVVIQYLLSSIL